MTNRDTHTHTSHVLSGFMMHMRQAESNINKQANHSRLWTASCSGVMYPMVANIAMRPCFSSVWRRRLKFSTLPSAVNPAASVPPSPVDLRLQQAMTNDAYAKSNATRRHHSAANKLNALVLRDPRIQPGLELRARSRTRAAARRCSWPSHPRRCL